MFNFKSYSDKSWRLEYNLFSYYIKLTMSSRWEWTYVKLHKYNTYWHFVWGRLSVLGGPILECSECNVKCEVGEEVCQDCYEHSHCECGQVLEDAYGSPGDGFCIRCR